MVAPVNAQQTTGINAINGASGVQNPFNTQATGLATAGAGAINATPITGSTISQYESPYQQQVINATEGEINNQNQQQSAALTGNLAASGALGGDRAGIAQAALAGQQDLASNATLANLNNQNYEQALGEANTQQQTALGAAQNTAARQLQAGTNLGSLGSTAQNEALNEGSAQTAAGTLQQQTSQAADTANYNQYLQQQAYPFQTTSWLASILGGLGGLAGSTTNQDQTQYTSGLSSILGAGLGLASLLPVPKARGGRVPHMASGGGLGGVVTPYSDATGMIAPGAGSWVPVTSGVVGHLAQSGGMGGGSMQGQNGLNTMAQTAKGIQGLGTGLTNAFNGLSDLGSDASLMSMPAGESLFPGGLARGGAVWHYDDGGNVSANDLLFDPSALGDSGLGTVQPIPNVTGSAPPAVGFIPNAPDVPPVATPVSASGLGAASASAADPTFARMLAAESNNRQFTPSGQTVTSPAGAEGIAQIMPGTAPEAARLAGLDYDPARLANDPAYNAALGEAYYKKQLADFGSPDKAAAAYNAGPGAVEAALVKADKFGGSYLDYLSPETQAYVAKVMGNGQAGLGGAAIPAGALAYDDTSSTNPITGGLGAIAGLLSGGHSATPNASTQPEANLGFLNQAVGASPQEGGGLFDLSPNTRLGMLSMGLGMMAGTSVDPWVNIGKGGLAGIQTMMQGAKNASGIGLQQAQTQQVKTQTQLEQENVALMMAKLKQFAQLQKNRADQISKATAGNPITAPQQPTNPALQTIPGSVAPAPMAPVAGMDAPANQGTSVAQKQIDPSFDPAILLKNAEAANYIDPKMAANYRDQALAYLSGKTAVRYTDGSYGFIPGYNQAAAGQAATIQAAKSAAQHLQQTTPAGILERDPNNPSAPPKLIPWSAVTGQQPQSGNMPTPPVDPRLMSKEGAGIVANETKGVLDRASQAYDSANSTRMMLAQMQHDLANLPTSGWLAAGPGFQDRAKVAGDINQVLRTLGVHDSNLIFNPQTIASGEELKKLTTRLGFDLARTLGSREAAMIINQATAAVPSGDNSPMGAKRLLAGIGSMAQRQQDWYSFVQRWTAQTGGSTLGAQDAFNKMHPPQQYADNAVISTIPAGAVQLLRQKPALAAQFDQKYGVGVSKMILGAGNGQ